MVSADLYENYKIDDLKLLLQVLYAAAQTIVNIPTILIAKNANSVEPKHLDH